MPPLPVTGLCCLPRSRRYASNVLGDPFRVAVAASEICLNEAESMLSDFDVAEDLVFERDRRIVDFPRGLRHRAGRLDDAVAFRGDGA